MYIVCGEREEEKGRIVGGADASPHEFKWQVLIKSSGQFASVGSVTNHLCGGSLINDRYANIHA